jgi:integrase/recombinase XerD
MADRKGKRPGEVYTAGEVTALLAQCSRRAPTGIRDRALLTLIYRTGIRIHEALDLKPSDVDFRQGTVRVSHGKGDKLRTVGIGDGALAVLQLWMEKRRELGLARRGSYVFTTIKGGQMGYSHADSMLKRRAAKAGIDKRAHLHGLRHSWAHDANIVRKLPLTTIQEQLGHERLSTTSVYLKHIAPADVIAAGREDTWADD